MKSCVQMTSRRLLPACPCPHNFGIALISDSAIVHVLESNSGSPVDFWGANSFIHSLIKQIYIAQFGQYNTIQYNTIQYNTIQYSTVQYSTVQYSTVQYSTVQYNTIQYNTIAFDCLTWPLFLYFTQSSEVHTPWRHK